VTRNKHTPAEKAQAAVDVLQRRLDRHGVDKRLKQQQRDVTSQCEVIEKRLAYAKASPDLAQVAIPAQPVPS
jgi:hypothetical protein